MRAKASTRVNKRKTTTQKGLGWRHQQQREKLLRRHKDGDLCWWCGKPMYKDKAQNFDGFALAADHSVARAHGGRKADRLLHHTCNSTRGAGGAEKDELRPAALREQLKAEQGVNPGSTVLALDGIIIE